MYLIRLEEAKGTVIPFVWDGIRDSYKLFSSTTVYLLEKFNWLAVGTLNLAEQFASPLVRDGRDPCVID